MTTTADRPADFEAATFTKIATRLIPLLFAGYVVAFLDRVNVGFAKLQMASELGFSDAVYGFGAGIFFIGYFIFELPSNLILKRVGARIWLARIMITWGVVSAAFLFTGQLRWGPIAAAFHCTDAAFSFYALRFLLGIAEAGFYPGVILYLTFWFPAAWRAQMVAWFMAAIAVSNVFGSPLSGAILSFADGAWGLSGWQWLFVLEAIPSVLVGILILVLLPDGPNSARWLTPVERDLVAARLETEEKHKVHNELRHTLADIFKEPRVWALTLIYFCGVLGFYAVSFWMPTIIEEMGVDKGDYFKVGLITMLPWTVAAIAQVLWAGHSDRTGERRWHSAIGGLVAVAGLLLLAWMQHAPLVSLFALSLVAAGFLCSVVVYWTLPTAFLAGTAAAGGIALINSIGNLGGYFGPDLIGRIREASGGETKAAFLALAGAALVGAIVTILTPGIQAKDTARS